MSARRTIGAIVVLTVVATLLGGGPAPASAGQDQEPPTYVEVPWQVDAGSTHTCAIREDATLKCWGSNHDGELGYGDTTSRGDEPDEMGDDLPAVDLGDGRTPTAVAAGGGRTCVVLDDLSAECWGSNENGELGQGDTETRGDAPNELGDDLDPIDLGTGRTATTLATGENHTCALLDDATVRCWGRGANGELGQGDGEDRGDESGEMGDALPAIDLGTGRTATAVTAGFGHTCALLDDGAVRCWGRNNQGQLGQGHTTNLGDDPGELGDALPTVDLGTGRTATAVVAAGFRTCALLDDGAVRCWGDNVDGALGVGDTEDRGDEPDELGDALPTVDLGTGRTATAISAVAGHTCALLDDGAVRCWGDNHTGQLGIGDTDDRGDEPDELGDALPTVDLGTGRTATAISAGTTHSCALLDDDTIRCWGEGADGRLGQGSTSDLGDAPGELGDALPPVDLGTLGSPSLTVDQVVSAETVTAGEPITFTITIRNTGDTTLTGISVDADVDTCEQPVPDLAEGADHIIECSIETSLSTVGWFLNRTVVATDTTEPVESTRQHVEVVVPPGYPQVEPGHSLSTCAIREDGMVKCWGDGRAGELGTGSSTILGDDPGEMGDALPTVDLGTGRTAVQLAGGNQFFCALLDDGTVRCWGVNGYGQLGQGHTDALGDDPGEMGDALPTVDLGTGRTAVAIAAGLEHACAILDDGTAKCWGRGRYGRLGQGHTANLGDEPGEMGDALPAIDLGTGRTAAAISSRNEFNCVIRDDDSLVCWGNNGRGQLGRGDTRDQGDGPGEMGGALVPVDLGPGRFALQVTTARFHTCALLDDLTIKCWGENGDGQLGLGDVERRGDEPGEMGAALPAVDLGSDVTAAAVVAGYLRGTCARLLGGDVTCWGDGANGVLGSGSEADVGSHPSHMGDALPVVDVEPDEPVVFLAGGIDLRCAVLGNRGIKCWGNGAFAYNGHTAGDLGDEPGEMGAALPYVQLGAASLGAIEATITSAGAGGPVTGAQVAALDASTFTFVAGATTDTAGFARIDAQPGDYALFVVDAAGEHAAGVVAPSVSITPAQTTTVGAEITLATGTITGTVSDDTTAALLDDVLVAAIDATTGRPGPATITEGGSYTLAGVAPTDHFVIFADLTGSHAPQLHDGVPSLSDATSVPVLGGSTTGGVDASLTAQAPPSGSAHVTGTITDARTSDAIEGAVVLALDPDTFQLAAGTTTDGDGDYDLALDPGDYKLEILDPTGERDMEWYDDLPFWEIADAATVSTSAGSPATADAQLTPSAGEISGTVVEDGAHSPLEGAWVVAFAPDGTVVDTATTAADGSYTLDDLPAGEVRLLYVTPDATHVPEHHLDSPDYDSASPITVDPAVPTDGVDAALTPA